jgi:hypothetical protein
MALEAIDYSELDPGVRELVRILREHDFDTSDSGDGVTKLAAGWTPEKDSVLEVPHVHIPLDYAELMIRESHRLRDLLNNLGILVSEGMIQTTYDPHSEIAILSLYMVSDKDLPPREP